MASVNWTKAMPSFLIAFSIWYEISNVFHSKINNTSMLIMHSSWCKKCFCRMIMPNSLLWQSAKQLFGMGSTFSSHGLIFPKYESLSMEQAWHFWSSAWKRTTRNLILDQLLNEFVRSHWVPGLVLLNSVFHIFNPHL